jgi:hypothetical protein
MESLYKTDFERFERYAPHGTVDDVADALQPYLDAGARSFDLVAVAGDADTALECVADVRSLLVS